MNTRPESANPPLLQPMRPEDLEAIMVIENVAYTHPWTAGIFRDCLRVGYNCWVLREGEMLTGYGVMSVGAGEAHILNLCIRPDSRKRGLGRAMLDHLLHLARRYGAEAAFLEVRPSNRAALHLYEAAGFRQVGLRRDYYPDTTGREDALILSRRFDTPDIEAG